MKFLRVHIGSFGIEFRHKGDSVLWMFPWKRSDKKLKFMSMGFNHLYESLKAIDKDWKGYFKALGRT